MQSKIAKRVFSVILSVSLMLQMGMPVVYAAEGTPIETKKTIIAFADLAEDVKTITAAKGTEEEELPLPETVNATVQQAVYEETTTDSSILAVKESEKTQAAGSVEEVALAVTWESDKPFSSEEAGVFTYTAKLTDESYILAEGVELPQICVQIGNDGALMLMSGAAGENITVDSYWRNICANGNAITLKAGTDNKTLIYLDSSPNTPVTLNDPAGKLQGNPTEGYDLSNYLIEGGSTTDSVSSTKITMEGGQVRHIMGGGEQGSVGGNTTVTISGGTMSGDVYGGGNVSSARVAGTTNVTISGGTISGSIYGGGYNGSVGENTTVTISGGTISGSVYGGGFAGTVGVNTNVTINGGTISGDVYGGGVNGTVTGSKIGIVISAKVDATRFDNGFLKTDTNTYIAKGSITLPSDFDFTLPEEAKLTVQAGAVITNQGKLTLQGEMVNNGTFDNNGTIKNDGGSYSGSGTWSGTPIEHLKITVSSAKEITDSSAKFTVNCNRDGMVYYLASDTPISDTNTLGTSGMSQLISANSDTDIALTQLKCNQSYTYYVAVKAGRVFTPIQIVPFTTPKKLPNLQLTGTVSGKVFDDTPIAHSTAKDELFTWEGDGAIAFTYFTDNTGTKTTTADNGAAGEGTAPKNAGTYYLKAALTATDEYVGEESEYTLFTITQSGTNFDGGIKTYKENTETSEFTYGDTITVKVTPKATGTAASGMRMLRSFSAPTANQMALFFGDIQITEPQTAVSGQELTFSYDTTGTSVITPDSSVDITAKYVGNANMTDYSQSIPVIVYAVAEVTKKDAVSYAGTLQGAFDLIKNSETGTIKVLKDIDLGSTTNVDQTTGTVTLDLNGKTISAALTPQAGKQGVFYIGLNANLTITDSKENGEIRNVAEGVVRVIATSGTFSINGGKLYSACSMDGLVSGTAVSVYGGTTTVTGNACLQGKQYAMQATSGTVNIQGGQLSGTHGVYFGDNAEVSITGGLIQGLDQSIDFRGINDLIIDGATLIGTVFDSNEEGDTGIISFSSGALFGDAKEGNYYKPDEWTDLASVKGWQVKGSITLPVDAEIPSDKTFTVDQSAVLTIANGATLTNNGTLLLKGTLNGAGTLVGTGEFKTTAAFTADEIQPISNQTYTGSAIEPAVTINPKTIMNQKFAVDTSVYDKTYENNMSAGTAKAVFTNKTDENVKIEKSFTIVQSGTTFDGGIKTYKENTETSEFNYSDTITIKVTPKATGTLPAANGLRMLRSFSAPTANQMALFVGDTQISDAVSADQNNVFTMTYDTSDKDLIIGDNIITAKYVGNGNMENYSNTVTVTLNKKVVTAAVADSQSKVYDGTNGFKNVQLSLMGIGGDRVTATTSGTVTEINVGTGKAFTASSITLTGDHKDYYSLAATDVSGNVSITQAAVAGVNQELQVLKDLAKDYTFDLMKLLPALSEGKSFGAITYTVGTVTNTNHVLAQNPTDNDIADGKITLKAAKAADKDQTATVQIKVKSTNYGDFIADLNVKTIDKTPLTIEGAFEGGMYNGKPYAYTGTPTFKNGIEAVSGITYTAKYAGRDGTIYEESENAPTGAGKYSLILNVSGESANIYAGTTAIDFEITKKPITAKPKDVSIASNAAFPTYIWSIETGVAGETIKATNAEHVTMQAQENGIKLNAVKAGSFDIVFDTVPEFNLSGDMEKNYAIQIGQGRLTVTKHSSDGAPSGGGGGGGGGSLPAVKENSVVTVTTPSATTDNSNPLAQATITVTTAVTNGTARVSVSQSTVEEAISKAQTEANKNGIAVEVKVDTQNSTAQNLSANLSKATIEALVKAEVKVFRINSDEETINIDLETLKTIQKQVGADVIISAKKVDTSTLSDEVKAVVGNRPVVDFTITDTNGKKVTDFDKGKVSISIPYTLGTNEKAKNVVAYYINNDGKVQEVPNSVYDEKSKTLTFVTENFSTFAVGYKEDTTAGVTPTSVAAAAFTDIAAHWAKKDIEFVTERRLFGGTAQGEFSPNMPMTRGMFVTVLGRLAKADTNSYKGSSFADVKPDAYYTPYIVWANKNGIVNGTSEATFAPKESITREQLAVIMVSYAQANGLDLPQVQAENTFADHAKISSYAKTAVKQMQMSGILGGKNGSQFDPQGTATRAEVSVVLKRFAELAEK